MKQPDGIPITRSVRTICRTLGMDPSQVARLDIRPTEVEATVYLLNEDGSKYTVPPFHGIATEIRTFKVKT